MNSFTRVFHSKLFIAALFVAGFLFARVDAASAASLYFSPSSGNYNVGQDFSVSVYVSSADQAMNAAQGAISYPSDRLQVTSLSKAGSIMSLWVQEPSYASGAINFEGIVLNPGFTGGAGKIITINFKVKAAGSGTLSFTSGSVLANDGQGTNILSGLSTANFSLISTVAPETPTPTGPQVKVPAAPNVTSQTHPDQEKWYVNNNPKFEWTLPRGITGVNVLADREPNSDPGTHSDGVMTSYTFNDVDDGTWYFHIKLQNSDGWGKVTHFKFRVDTEKPELLTVEPIKDDGQSSSPQFRIEGKDKTSGIEYYDIKIDNAASEVWKDTDGTHIYTAPSLDKGTHTMVVKAFDKAGNQINQTIEFESTGILPPRITKYPITIDIGEPLAVRGNTYPNSSVTLTIEKAGEKKQQSVRSEEDGTFTVIATDGLDKGEYTIYAEVTDAEGHTSGPSDKVKTTVESPAFLGIGRQAADILIIAIPSFFFLLVLFLLLYHIWRKLRDTKKHLRKQIRDVEISVHDAFQMLHIDMKKHLKLLESAKNKRDLTREEEKIMVQMKRDIELAEKIVNKEINDIKEEVE